MQRKMATLLELGKAPLISKTRESEQKRERCFRESKVGVQRKGNYSYQKEKWPVRY